MEKVKIFLASSVELEDDIIRFGDAIRGINNLLAPRGIYFDLRTWRDHSTNMVKEGSQSEYNESVKEADIFILLAYSKIGEFTEMEFDHANKWFLERGAPLIFPFFKDTTGQHEEDSLRCFKEKLVRLNHYLTTYTDFNQLWHKISKELELLMDNSPSFRLLKDPDSFNSIITKRTMEAIAGINPDVASKLDVLKNISPHWESDKRYSDKAKDFVFNMFTGVLSTPLNRLIAIGKSEYFHEKSKDYICMCLHIGKIFLQILVFSLISRLWKERLKDDGLNFKISGDQSDSLKEFFDGNEMDFEQYFALTMDLIFTFKENGLAFPIPELVKHVNQFTSGTELHHAIKNLNQLNKANEYSFVQCGTAENSLSTVLENFVFLTEYKMISVKAVNYDSIYERSDGFFHNYIPLINKASQNCNNEVLTYHNLPVQSDGVLLYKNSYTNDNQCINLFPFVVDLNSLNYESGNKICFFSQKMGVQNILNYRFLEVNEPENIEFKNILKINDPELIADEINRLIVDKNQRIQLKLDNTFRMYANAAKTLAGLDFNLNSDPIFEF